MTPLYNYFSGTQHETGYSRVEYNFISRTVHANYVYIAVGKFPQLDKANLPAVLIRDS